MSRWSSLPLRILSSILLIALVAAALYYDLIIYAVFIVAIIALIETTRALYNGGAGRLIYVSTVLSALLLLIIAFFKKDILSLTFTAGIILIISVGLVMQIKDIKNYLMAIFGFIYPTLFISYLLMLLKFSETRVIIFALLLNIVLVSASDVFAYFTGMLIGKKQLCPVISPKKTIEGAVGGFIAAVIFSYIVGIIASGFGLNIEIWHYLIMGVLCGIFSQFGDLIASVIKRNVGIKDYAGILPGMGGIMDRIDGIIFCSPIIYYYFYIVLGFSIK